MVAVVGLVGGFSNTESVFNTLRAAITRTVRERLNSPCSTRISMTSVVEYNFGYTKLEQFLPEDDQVERIFCIF